jgi:dipeptidyl-peptidase-4
MIVLRTAFLAGWLAAAGFSLRAQDSRPQDPPPTQPTTQSQPSQPAPASQPSPPPPPKDLSIDDALVLSRAVVREREPFLGWLDGQHFLTAADYEKDNVKHGRVLLRVNAAAGTVEPFLDHGRMASALAALPGFDQAEAKRLARDFASFQWSRDRKAILLNTAGDLIHYDVAAGRATRLTQTPGPEVGEQYSPDGRLVAYVFDYDLWVVGIDGSQPRALTTGGSHRLLHGRLDWIYQEEVYGRGNFQGFWWSPDSQSIALLRLDESQVPDFTLVADAPVRPVVEVTSYPKAGDPNPVAALGIARVRGGDLRWFDLRHYGTQELLIVRVQWHPDASEVYFQVQDREQRWLDLLAGDPRNGKVRVVLRETSPCWIEVDAEPFWFDDGKSFLWLSERDGWNHVYSYQRDGKELARVTKGDFEVESIAGVDPQARLVYYVATAPDVKQQHLWRIGLDGNGPAQLTKEPGRHDVTLSPDHALFADAFSNVDYVRRVDVRRMDGAVLRTLCDSDMSQLAPYQLAPPEFVRFPARDQHELEGMLLKPRGFEPGKRYPVVCFTYSGPHAPQVKLRWDRRHYLWHQLLAQKGYLVWACDNRTASGKGRQSAQPCFKNLGESELKDLEDGVDWLVAQGLADPARVALWGWSYGGYQTAFALTHSKKWSAGIAVNPVTDWALYDSIYTERYMSLPQTNPDGYRKSSVVQAAANLHGRFLLVHGAMDDNVHMQNSLQLAHALQTAGKPFELMVYPRVRHGIENQRQLKHLYQTMTEFLQRNL